MGSSVGLRSAYPSDPSSISPHWPIPPHTMDQSRHIHSDSLHFEHHRILHLETDPTEGPCIVSSNLFWHTCLSLVSTRVCHDQIINIQKATLVKTDCCLKVIFSIDSYRVFSTCNSAMISGLSRKVIPIAAVDWIVEVDINSSSGWPTIISDCRS